MCAYHHWLSNNCKLKQCWWQILEHMPGMNQFRFYFWHNMTQSTFRWGHEALESTSRCDFGECLNCWCCLTISGTAKPEKHQILISWLWTVDQVGWELLTEHTNLSCIWEKYWKQKKNETLPFICKNSLLQVQ